MKRLISFLLVLTMLMCGGISVVAFEDTKGLPCEDDVSLLFDLGIVDGKSNQAYAPADPLTRVEMVTYALRILGMDGIGTGRPVFEDVSEEHWGYANVTVAYDLGLVAGVSETAFLPDAPVTFSQAVKILTVALGYTVQAEAAGGYPSGYLIIAQQIGLLDGVLRDEEINRGTMASLTANALDIHPSQRLQYGDDRITVGVNESETLLSLYLGVDTFKGRVTANSTDTVAPSAAVKKGQIAVGDLLFAVGKTNAETFIGQNVKIRAKEENGKWTVLHIASDGNTVLSVAGKDVLPATTKAKLVLEGENGKEKVYSISGDAAFVYNGIPRAWEQTDLISDRSMYTFIMGRGGEIHTIFQNRYENRVVKSVSEEMKKVYFKDGTNLVFDEAEWKKYSLTKADGSSVELSAVIEWDVFSVCQNGTDVLKAVVSEARVEGTVTELVGTEEAVIDGEIYPIAKSLQESTDKKPTIGEKGIFCLDAYGQIAAVNNAVLSDNYGFIVSGSTKGGLDKTANIKLFLLSGEMKVFEVAEKAMLNNTPKDGSEILDDPLLKSGENVIRQLITYETDEEGKIKQIRTAADGTRMNWQERQGIFSKDFEIAASERASAGNYIGYTMSSLASRYKLTEKTRIIIIPAADNGTDQEYAVQEFRKVIHGDGFGDSTLYDIDKDNVISVIVQKKSFQREVTYGTENLAIVSGVVDMLDKEGLPIRALRIILPSGVERSLQITDDATLEIPTSAITSVERDPYVGASNIPFTALEKGDIIQYEADGQGRLTCAAVRLRYRYRYLIEKSLSQYGERAPEPNYNYNGTQYLYARVDRVVDNGVVVYAPAVADGTEYERLFSNIQDKTLLYNSARETITPMDYKDIEEGDKIFILRKLTDMMIVVVYR